MMRTRSLAVALWLLGVSWSASAQTTAEEMFQRAQQRAAALSDGSPSADSLRSAARAYEAIPMTYPKSGYADNALFEAAGLLSRAFEKSGDVKDRQKAIKLLEWLSREYPSSPLVRQADTRAKELAEVATTATAADAPAPPPTAPGDARAQVRGITRSELPRGDRITIELTQEVPYTHGRVPDPDRLFFDFTNASAAQALADQLRAIATPLVKAVRVGRPSSGVTRVVLDLEGRPKFSAFPLYGPFRVVVDVESAATPPPPAAGSAAPSTAGGPPAASVVTRPALSEAPPPAPPPAAPTTAAPPAPTTTPVSNPAPNREPARAGPAPAAPAILGRGEYSIARQLGLGISRIVIDPGHGGHDPGAQANGLSEADLVLDIALRLERLLQQEPGVEVVLTRRTDEFIALEERTAIANRAGPADLFLSIHANSARSTSVRGVETYFLNFATTQDAEAVAARENATSLKTMGTLPALLNAIALNNKLDESRELATILQTSMVRRLTAQNKNVRDLGVKQAPFVVLIGAQMPSVLSEISFLSNRNEASLLKQSTYRQHIAQALCDAIVKYQGSLKKITTSQRR